MSILEGKNIEKSYKDRTFLKTSYHQVLKDIHLELEEGEILALVGESGSGKSTLANILGFLIDPDQGEVIYKGRSLKRPLDRQDRLDIQMVFQDPFMTLHPRKTVGQSLYEPLRLHKIVQEEDIKDYLAGLLNQCGLSLDHLDRYPRALSGGQLQRLNIVRALSLKPKILIADEIITALDTPIALEIIHLLKEIRDREKISILFISHDLASVRRIADRILVMKDGEILERGQTQEIFQAPKNAYTKKLLASIPRLS